jgi:hypothetical protein
MLELENIGKPESSGTLYDSSVQAVQTQEQTTFQQFEPEEDEDMAEFPFAFPGLDKGEMELPFEFGAMEE